MFKKALIALALLVSATGASSLAPAFAQTADQTVPGYYANAPQTGCTVGPCFVPYGQTVPVSGTFSASLAGFSPTAGATANLSVSNVSSSVNLPAGADVVITNTGATDASFRLTAGAGTAVTTDQVLKAGAATGLHVLTQTVLSAITASSTTTLNVQGGTGLASGYGGGGSSAGGGTSVAQGSTTAGQSVSPMGCRTLTSAPTDTTAQTNMPSCTTAGALRMDGSGSTQPVSAASLPLPTGASTSALQTTANTSLATIATNSGSPIPAGAAIIGQTGIDQTTDGTTNAVHLKAGTAIAGKFGIDQTTPGTTNLVAAGQNGTWTVQPGNTANTTAWKVDGSAVTQPTSVASGANVVEGAINDAAGCASGSAKTMAGCLAQIHSDAIAATPAGSNIIGKVGIDQTTLGTTNAVQNISGTTGGTTPFTLTAANSTNATNIKASAGTLYHIGVYNNSATLAWVSFYNTAGTPTCGTSIVYQTMIPANSTSGAGAVEDFATGMAFGTGIGICVTTGIAGTGAVAASSYVVGLGYK